VAELPGKNTTWLEATRKHHDDVREVARLMCEELCIDPDVVEHCYEYDVGRFTPYEQVFGNAEHRQGGASIQVKRWELFRRDAALALAGWRAVHKHALTKE
jgi:hypothetical protein